MKKLLLLFSLGIAFLFLFYYPNFQRAFWTALVVSEILNFESRGWLDRWTEPPRISSVAFQGPSGPLQADLYEPPSGAAKAGILLNHGVVDTGKDDPRLKRFAEILCRAGFLVFVPEFRGMRSFRVSSGDVDEIQAAYEAFLSRGEKRGPWPCGLFGFSYGAGPTLIAASRPGVRAKVKFLVSFGGYYDLKNVLSFMATGHFEYEGKKYFRKPQEYGKWVFLANNLDWVQSSADRFTLEKIIAQKLRDENAKIDSFLPALGPEGRNILALLNHPDPGQTEKLIQMMPANIRQMIESLSVAPAIPHLQADLILAHGEEDDLIPFTETLRIAQNAPDPDKVHLQILKSFSHVDPDQKALTLKNFFEYHLPEGWKLFSLVNRLMKYPYPSG